METSQSKSLSPAAQAVMDAASLRAAVGQAHPKINIEDINYVHQNYVDGWKDALDVILTIADELEGSVTYNPPEDGKMEETQWTMLMN
jgi:hypothetical protein